MCVTQPQSGVLSVFNINVSKQWLFCYNTMVLKARRQAWIIDVQSLAAGPRTPQFRNPFRRPPAGQKPRRVQNSTSAAQPEQSTKLLAEE